MNATDRQLRFASSLLDERDYAGHKWETRMTELRREIKGYLAQADAGFRISEDRPDGWEPPICPVKSQTAASALISTLLECPKRKLVVADGPETPDVPAGRYAIPGGPETDGELRFYKVGRPEAGPWAGFIFVSVMASDTEYPVKGESRIAVLEEIRKDPAAASAAYGQHIGSCGICGRTLTNAESRAYGIGPECAAKLGW